LGSFFYDINELKFFEADQGPTTTDIGVTTVEGIRSADKLWTFSGLEVSLETETEPGTTKSYHRFTMAFEATRTSTSVVIIQVFPLLLLGLVTSFAYFMNPGKDTRIRFLSATLMSNTILAIGIYATLPRMDSASKLPGFILYTLLHVVMNMIIVLLLKSAYMSASGWLFEKSKDIGDEEKKLKLLENAIDSIKVEARGFSDDVKSNNAKDEIGLHSLRDNDSDIIQAAKMAEHVTRKENQAKAQEINFIRLLFKIFFTRTRLRNVPLHQKKKAFKFVTKLNDVCRVVSPVAYLIICLIILAG
jgi:hypothetical protein